jgi:hypothetical protein
MMKVRHILSSLAMVLVLLLVTGYAHGAENLLANGGFEDGVMDPWSIYGDAPGEVVQAGAIEGKYCLHVTTPKGGNFWDAGLQHAGHIFETGKSYTLAAFLKSPDKLEINFKPELGEDPWTGYGSQAFTMTETWQEYHIETGAIPDKVDPATITFHIAYEVGEFYIDAVRFYEGAYTPGEVSAVRPQAKLATVWGKIKAY